MLTCLALLVTVSLSDIPSLAGQVETEARTLSAAPSATPEFMHQLETFSSDAERLSASLRQAGVSQDMPCIFHGISEDAQVHLGELQTATTDDQRGDAMRDIKALLDDAILIAPMAASAAADAQAAAAAQPAAAQASRQ